jgi:hypothetical protein
MDEEMSFSEQPTVPQTLAEVHQLLDRIRPATDAPPSTWRAYRQYSSKVYAQVADIDRLHHHEAMYWARQEGKLANEIRPD